MHPIITPQIINAGFSYSDFRKHVVALLAEGKTTGPDQSRFMTELTQHNLVRMDHAEAIPVLPELVESLNNLPRNVTWLVINEAWCTDASHHVPVLASLAACSPKVDLRIILRSDYPEVMDAYLTNGGRSIPKLVCVDAETLTELGTWGPRPINAQELAIRLKKEENLHITEVIKQMDMWAYNDKGHSLQTEFLELVKTWSAAGN